MNMFLHGEDNHKIEWGDTILDRDHYDDYCHHLLVRRTDTNAVVGSTRILTTPNARLPAQPASKINMPPLLKAYLKLGAWVAGEPCFDPDFNVADIFILLDVNNLFCAYNPNRDSST
jgi:putative hemolysin